MSHSHRIPLSPDQVRRLDRLCDQFETALQRGECPVLEDYLSKVEESLRRALLCELLYLECEQRQQVGELILLEDYQARFPEEVSLIQEIRQGLARATCPSVGTGREPVSAQRPVPAEADTSPGIGDHTVHFEKDQPGARYELMEQVGQGGMGVVYRCLDRHLGRQTAIKILSEYHQNNVGLLRRFEAEARLTSQLQHPSIVPVYDLGRVADQRPYFAMKLIQGRTLDTLLQERKDPAEELPYVLSIFEQICQAVAYAHSVGVIHRDLKPHNVMVGAFGEVQVMDWGFAKIIDPDAWRSGDGQHPPEEESSEPFSADTLPLGAVAELSQEGTVIGTLSYIPTEQARGEVSAIDQRADVFGLGAILCTILTGKPPYEAGSTSELLQKAMAGDLTEAFARLEASGADSVLRDLAKKCLSPRLEDRPGDAGKVAEEISRYRASVQEQLRQATVERAIAEGREQETRAKLRAERRVLWFSVALGVMIVLGLSGLLAGSHLYQRDLKDANTRIRREEEIARKQRDAATTALKQSRRSAYNLRLVVVETLRHSNPRYALDLLEDEEGCPEELRDFTWKYYHHLCKRNLRTIPFRSEKDDIREKVIRPSCSADGRLLALAINHASLVPVPLGISEVTRESRIILWDMMKEQVIAAFSGPDRKITSLALSPDGKRVAIATADHTASVWSVETHKEVLKVRDSTGRIAAVAFSPDGKLLATGAHQVKLFDARTGEEKMSRHKIFESWARDTPPEKRAELLAKFYRPYHYSIRKVVFSPDGRTLVTQPTLRETTTKTYPITLWDVECGKPREWLEDGKKRRSLACRDFAFSPDGKLLATLEPEKVCLRNATTLECVNTLSGTTGFSLAWSPDGQRLAIKESARIVILDTATGKEVDRLEDNVPFFFLLWPLPGRTLVTTGPLVENKKVKGSQLTFWDLGRDPLHAVLTDRRVGALTFTPDSQFLVGTAPTVWNVKDGKKIHSTKRKNNLRAVFLSADGRTLHCVHRYTGEVCRFDLCDGTWIDHRNVATGQNLPQVECGVFTADGTKAALAFTLRDPSGDWLRVQEVSTRRTLWEKQTGPGWRIDPSHGKRGLGTYVGHEMAFSPNGKVLAVVEQRTVVLFDAATGKETGKLEIGFGNSTQRAWFPDNRTKLAWSPDNRTLAVAGEGAIGIWKTDSPKPFRMLEDPQYLMKSVPVAFSPDGKTLASGGPDGMIRLWDPISGQLRATLRGHKEEIYSLAFSPNGRYLASISGNTIRVHEAP